MFLPWFVLVTVGLTSADRLELDSYFVTIDDGYLLRVEATNKSSESLDLSGLGIKRIDQDCFANIRGLKKLNLSNNGLTYNVPLMPFRCLGDLKHLDLSQSYVTPGPYTFLGLSNLEILNLTETSNESLEDGTFFGLPRTTKILVSKNTIDVTNDQYFVEPGPLVTLCIVDEIVKSAKLFDLNETDVGNCVPTYGYLPDTDAFNLPFLSVKGFASGWFQFPRNMIRFIDLYNNMIETLTPEILNDLPPSVQHIDLTHNLIKSVKEGVLKNPYIRKLNLNNNPIEEIDHNAFAAMNLSQLLLPDKFSAISYPGVSKPNP